MKYLCLVYLDEQTWNALSRSEYDALVGEILDFREELRSSGRLIVADALQHVQPATSLRVRNATVAVTDGPFAETKEQLGGFYLIEARDLNDAIQVAARNPSARTGSIEVRPVVDFGEQQ